MDNRFRRIIPVLVVGSLAVATYSNLSARKDLQFQKLENQKIELENGKLADILAYDSLAQLLEGINIGKEFQSPSGRRYSIILAEAHVPCAACFNMALHYLVEYSRKRAAQSWPRIVVSSHRARDLAILYAKKGISKKEVSFESSMQMHRMLNISDRITFAMLVNSEGTVVHAIAVNAAYPHAFERFLAKSNLIMGVGRKASL